MGGRGINAMPGRPQGEGSRRVEERELQEAARRHDLDEQAHAHDPKRAGFFSRLFRRDRAGR
jgi:hypothetical protein